MIRIAKLDVDNTEPPYPHTRWNEEAILKWLLMEARFSVGETYSKEVNADGTVTFRQEQKPTAIRIFHSP